MSVLKCKRKQSRLEVYVQAIKLRKSITYWLMRDMGVRTKTRSLEMTSANMSDEDKSVMLAIAAKYDLTKFPSHYPRWVVLKLRDEVWQILSSLCHNITAAASIYPTIPEEILQRRIFMDKAVGNAEQLLKEMEFAMEILPVDADKLIPYVSSIEHEIALIKAWRKSDNKRMRKLGVGPPD